MTIFPPLAVWKTSTVTELRVRFENEIRRLRPMRLTPTERKPLGSAQLTTGGGGGGVDAGCPQGASPMSIVCERSTKTARLPSTLPAPSSHVSFHADCVAARGCPDGLTCQVKWPLAGTTSVDCRGSLIVCTGYWTSSSSGRSEVR